MMYVPGLSEYIFLPYSLQSSRIENRVREYPKMRMRSDGISARCSYPYAPRVHEIGLIGLPKDFLSYGCLYQNLLVRVQERSREID